MVITRAMARRTEVGRCRTRSLSSNRTSAPVEVEKMKNVPKKSAAHTPRTQKRPVAAVRQSLDDNTYRLIQSIQEQGPRESNIPLRRSRSRSPLYSDIHGVQVRLLARGRDTEPVIIPVPLHFCDYNSRDILFGQDTIRITINRVRCTSAHSPVRRHSTGSRLRHQDIDQLRRSSRTPVPRKSFRPTAYYP